jgi:hypothetical protein
MSAIEQFSQFDMSHWLRVKAERSRLGIVRNTESGKQLPHHPLVGRTLTDPETGNQYYVESVKKDWLQGWFLLAKLNRNGSHLQCVVENHSSVSPDAIRSHFMFKEMFAASL